MAASLTPPEQAQLRQTIDMFQVIVQSDPTDYQSLEILKEAYLKLGMSAEVVATSKKIAEAYVQLGQLSSAIMEYETILQQFPDDAGVRKALEEIESKTTSFAGAPDQSSTPGGTSMISMMDVDDGRAAMKRIFVDGKLVGEDVFNRLWSTPVEGVGGELEEPFLQTLADKAGVHLEDAMRRVADRAKIGYIPIERYDTDVEMARKFPKDLCLKWCLLPFDRMSKAVMVATANPFNRQAEAELKKATNNRVLWYFASPPELMKMIKKVFR
jgi:hypothetical protein